MPYRYWPGRRPIQGWVRIAIVGLAAVLVRASSAEAHARRDRRGQLRRVSRDRHGRRPMLTVTADPATLSPGASVTFTLSIRSPTIKVGGAYVTTGGVGTLQALPGEGLAVNAQGLTHTAPKAASNGAVTFRFGWQAPAKPGAVDVHVAVLAATATTRPPETRPASATFSGSSAAPRPPSTRISIATGTGPRSGERCSAARAIAAPTGLRDNRRRLRRERREGPPGRDRHLQHEGRRLQRPDRRERAARR